MLLNFLFFPAETEVAGLPAHVQHAMRDIPTAWNQDLEEDAQWSLDNNILTTQILAAQALVMAERATTERDVETC